MSVEIKDVFVDTHICLYNTNSDFFSLSVFLLCVRSHLAYHRAQRSSNTHGEHVCILPGKENEDIAAGLGVFQ